MAYTAVSSLKNISISSIQAHTHCLWHDACFLVVLNGDIQVNLDGRSSSLSGNDIMLIEPDTSVEILSCSNNLVMSILLEHDFFMKNRPDQIGIFICNSAEDNVRDYSLLRHMLGHLALIYYEKAKYKELRQQELCFSLMYYLNVSHFVSHEYPSFESNALDSPIRQIATYIDKNYMHDIHLADLAKSIYLSPSYLSRSFKKLFGVNFKTYLEDIRLRHAVENMRNTDQTITEIAYNNGFPNVTALRTALRKKYSLLPNELRKSFPEGGSIYEAPLPNQNISYDNIKGSLMTLAGPEPPRSLGLYNLPGQVEYIVDDVSETLPIRPIWKQMINVGTLHNLLKVNISEPLELVQKEIGFVYARIEGVLTESSVPTLSDGKYSFSQFDRAIKLLLSHNLIPFLDLSFKGSYLHLSRSQTVFRSAIPDPSFADHEYFKKASALIRHCINMFGANEVGRWGIEISIEHDKTLNLLETPNEFASRFQQMYVLIKQWLPTVIVGGPEFNLVLDSSILGEIIQCLQDRKIYPDFISLCAVPYEAVLSSDKSMPLFSSNENYIREHVQSIHESLSSSFSPEMARIPIWVTVFGQDVRTRNHVNDSCYQASFILKNTLDLIGLVDVIGYWQLSDLDSESFDTTRLLFGGTGILSKDCLKKPGFTVLKRLSGINTSMVSCEGNMLITTNAVNTYNIVLCNYAHFTDLYCLSVGDGVTQDNVYTVFRDASMKDIRITLNGLEKGRYRVISSALNRESGSLFDEWSRYGIIDELQPQDINYLQDIVHPKRTVRYYECKDGKLRLNLQMLPHEVNFLLVLREI